MTAAPIPTPPQQAQIDALREKMQRLSGPQGGVIRRPVGTPSELADLVQLSAGGTYAVDTARLATTLLSGPSTAGEWCAVVGMDDFGAEAAAAVGVELDRTVLVPDPGEHWVEVTAALIDVVTAMLLRPPAGVREATAAKLAARLRKRGGVLVVLGEWPRAEVRLTTHASRWSGLGQGHGYLTGQQVDVVARRGAAAPRRTTLCLPGGQDRRPDTRPRTLDVVELAG